MKNPNDDDDPLVFPLVLPYPKKTQSQGEHGVFREPEDCLPPPTPPSVVRGVNKIKQQPRIFGNGKHTCATNGTDQRLAHLTG